MRRLRDVGTSETRGLRVDALECSGKLPIRTLEKRPAPRGPGVCKPQRMKISLALALVFGVAGWISAARAAEIAHSAPSPAPLTSVAAVRALSHQEASRELPVDIQATVTFFRGYEQTLFIQQENAGIYVRATTEQTLEPGDVVRVRGYTGADFSPIVNSHDITLLRHGAMPKPIAATWASLIEAEYDCRWVSAKGTILLAEKGVSSDHSHDSPGPRNGWRKGRDPDGW